MYELDGVNYFAFYVKGTINNEDVYFTANLDFQNNTFSIIPSDSKGYNSNIKTPGKSSGGQEKQIEPNSYNSIPWVINNI